MNIPKTEALREEAARLAQEATTAPNMSEYPRRAASVRRELSEALTTYADTIEEYASQYMHTVGSDRAAKQARREARLRIRAAATRVESCRADMQSHRIGDLRPFGQPILVGHHSEKRHRRDLDRQHKLDRKRFELAGEAKELQRKASACASNKAVYSDDVDAIEKLQLKLAQYEERRDWIKSVNATWRKFKKPAHDANGTWEKIAAHLGCELGRLTECRVGMVRHWREDPPPYDTYQLTNLGAEIRRLKKRIDDLSKEPVEKEDRTIAGGSVRVVQNQDYGKLELHFPGKPSDLVRTRLKQYGFRWIRTGGCWSRTDNEDTEARIEWLDDLLTKGQESKHA